MAPLPPAPGVCRATLEITHLNQLCRNVLHFAREDGDPGIDPNSLAAALGSWWDTNMQQLVSNDTTLTAVTATDLSEQGAPSSIWTPAAPLTGTGSSTSIAGSVTLAFSLITNLRGRSYRGRIYHIGLASIWLQGNRVTTSHAAALTAAYLLLLGLQQAPATALHLGVLSYYSANELRAAPVFTPVVNIKSDGNIDSQRRRLPGRGT